ncbi:MAG: hypothetical protein ACKOAH_25040 [Pirellula sp.]
MFELAGFAAAAGLAAAGLAAAGLGVAAGLAWVPTAMTLWHLGHLTPFPAIVSGTFKATPHWQVTRNGIGWPFDGKN